MTKNEFDDVCQRVNAGEEVFVIINGASMKVTACENFAGALAVEGDPAPVPYQMADLA